MYAMTKNRCQSLYQTQTDWPHDAGWNVDILHRNDPSQLLEAAHIFDLTAELCAEEKHKSLKSRL